MRRRSSIDLAKQRERIERARRMTPEERMVACIKMSRVVMEIHRAEDLIGMKIFAGGTQDLTDVRGILHVSRERLNPDLLRQVARRYGADVARTLDELLEELPLTDQ